MAKNDNYWAIMIAANGGLLISIIYDHKPEKYEVFNHYREAGIEKTLCDEMADALCGKGQHIKFGCSYMLQRISINETIQTLNDYGKR